MRTDQRTYRQFLAFDDADKKNPIHDLACLYLAQPKKLEKLAEAFGRPLLPCEDETRESQYDELEWRVTSTSTTMYTKSALSGWRHFLSHPISTQRGIAGYEDLVCHFRFSTPGKSHKTFARRYPMGKLDDKPAADTIWSTDDEVAVHIEVKSGKITVPNVIQQIETYRSHYGSNSMRFESRRAWVLAAMSGLSSAEKDALAHHQIEYIFLSREVISEFGESLKAEKEDAF